jgi:3-deoxy-D-manno-octulosonate 8-phosphate phosphatase (KDO 8-P phosphatase)
VSIDRAAVLDRARAVRLAIFDVDGVMTDGTLYIGARGEALKAFNILDGHGLKMLREAGVVTAILSGRKHAAVDRRAKELSIDHVVQGRSDKVPEFEKLIKRLKLEANACAYVGDDLPDLPVLRRCGLAVAVANAVEAVKAEAHYVTRAAGGRGAVREVCDLILAARGQLGAAAVV